MYHLLFSIAVLMSCVSGFSQRTTFQLEPYIGIQGAKYTYHDFDASTVYKGTTIGTGIRLNFNLRPMFTVVAGYSTNNIVGNNAKFPLETLFRLDFKYNFGFNILVPRLFISTETGIEWIFQENRLKVPIYIGTSYYLNSLINLFCRYRLPNVIENKVLKNTNKFENAFEIGLAFDTNWGNKKKNKPVCGGPPYILQ